MQKQLLKSFMVVVLFWWTVFLLAFSLSEPSLNLEALKKIHHLLPFFHFGIPATASALNALSLQITALKFWSAPLLGLTGVLALAGAGISALIAWRLQQARLRRERAGQKGWRGVRVTLGELPTPAVLPMLRADLVFDSPEAETEVERQEGPITQKALLGLPEAHQRLIQEIIKVLAAHPEAYVGPGHQGTLLEHSLHVLEAALGRLEVQKEPLLPVAAIAHDLGKITTFQKNEEGEWERTGWHDKASARILATLPAWWGLSEEDQLVLDLAVRYDHSSRNMPFPTKDILRRRALDLQNLLSTSDRTATAAEKQAILQDLPLPDLAFTAFMEALPTFPLHVAGHAPAKGVQAAGWKQGDFLFLLEHQCRERSMSMLAPEVSAALGGAFRAQHKLAPFTQSLFEGLAARQLLVTEWEQQSVSKDNALWNLQSGTKAFKSVLILRITEDMRLRLPETDTTYVLTVLGPLREPSLPGEMNMGSALDLKGLLKPGKKKVASELEAEKPKPSGGYTPLPKQSASKNSEPEAAPETEKTESPLQEGSTSSETPSAIRPRKGPAISSETEAACPERKEAASEGNLAEVETQAVSEKAPTEAGNADPLEQPPGTQGTPKKPVKKVWRKPPRPASS